MRIYSKIVTNAAGEITEAIFQEYFGPVALCKQSADQGLATYNSKLMMQNFMGDMKQRFGEQSGIFDQLTKANQAIYAAGPDQQGWGPQQRAAINTLTDQGVANNYQMAKAATGNALASIGGGNTFLPSSVNAGLTAQNAIAAANSRSNLQNQNTVANYEQGRNNWLNAGQALSGVASMEDPTKYGNQALAANENYFGQATQIFNQNQQAKSQMWGTIGGLAGSFLGPIGGALGTKLGGMLGGGNAMTGATPWSNSSPGMSADGSYRV